MCCRTEPSEDLALGLTATAALSSEARFLEGLVHFISTDTGMPGRDLRAQLGAELPGGDVLD
jgi:hypothetical protein